MGSAKKTARRATGTTTKTPSAASSSAPPRELDHWDRHPGQFHALTAIPPSALLLVSVATPFGFVFWLLAWNCVRTLLRSSGAGARQLGGHILTFYAAHRCLAVRLQDWGLELELTLQILATIVAGLIMGVAFKNCMQALLYVLSGFPDRPTSGSSSMDGVPAVVVPLQQAPRGLPPNVHGTKTFTVKVQLPLNGTSGKSGSFDGLAMVSDEKKSLQSFFDVESDAPGNAILVRLIATKGERGGLVGYFQAHRDGENLRILVDRILPDPSW